MIGKLTLQTAKKHQLLDITDDVSQIVKGSKIADGLVNIFARHTTCGLIISEVEDNLEEDFTNYFAKEGPKGPFTHSHGDLKAHDPAHAQTSHTPAHLLSAMIGQSQTIPITDGKMQLGTWQRICLLELDGPRRREVIIRLLDENS